MKTKTLKTNDFFVFVDGYKFYCNNGQKVKILKKDLLECKNRGISESELKCIVYSHLTEPINIEENITYYKQTNDEL